MVFRFAHHLQNRISRISNYLVDCDFNSSFEEIMDSRGRIIVSEVSGKPILDVDGTLTKRFIDIIVHKRTLKREDDLICFEVKKWNNTNSRQIEKDENNLRVLTATYGYRYGFHLTLHRVKEKSRWAIYQKGGVEEGSPVFGSQ